MTLGQPLRAGKFRSLKRWIMGLGVGVVVLALLGGTMVGVAEHYTAQPNFCASCHIMGPYYATWKKDPHGGRLHIACVECHYAPASAPPSRPSCAA